MSTLTPGTSLPFVPGMSFSDPTKQTFHKSQTLGYTNGYALKHQPMHPIGGGKIDLSLIDPADVATLDKEHLELQYRDVDRCETSPFVPIHVSLDKKVLHFKAYFTEEIVESPIETERPRFLDVYYYLVDDSVAITEPIIENSGITQGKYLTRQRMPTGDGDRVLHWKDLNVAMDLGVYGKKIRIYDCDPFTREYLTSQGIEVNQAETSPVDRYSNSRIHHIQNYKTPTDMDKLGKFLSLDRTVLRFYAIWDDREQLYGDIRKFIIHFYLSNDTMEIKEVHSANNGRDPFPTMINRARVPKIFVPKTFPSVEKEIIGEKGNSFFETTDLIVGNQIQVGNRKMMIYDADESTRRFYQARLNIEQPAAINLDQIFPKSDSIQHELPPYNGFGSLEDSAQNCKKIDPVRPKKNYIKMLTNGNAKLRFKAKMYSNREIDQSRRFVFEIRLSDDLIAIHEIGQKNGGMPAGRFLEPSRIAKPDSLTDNPEYYTINDFKIGNLIIAFSHRFQIIDCDEHVKNWILSGVEEAKKLNPDFIQSIKSHFE